MFRDVLLLVTIFLLVFSGCSTIPKNTSDVQRDPANRKAKDITLLAGELVCSNSSGQKLDAKIMNEYGPYTISYFLTPGSVFSGSASSPQHTSGTLKKNYGGEGSNLAVVSKPDLNVHVFKIESQEKDNPEVVTKIEFAADPGSVSKGWLSSEVKLKAHARFFFHNRKLSTTAASSAVLDCVLRHIDNLEL